MVLILQLSIFVGNKITVIYCVYPPNLYINDFKSSLRSILDTKKSKTNSTVIVDDININTSGKVNNYLDMIILFVFKFYINIFTRTLIICNHSCFGHILLRQQHQN